MTLRLTAMRWRALTALLVTVFLAAGAGAQRPLFGNEADRPSRSWVTSVTTDSAARAAIGESAGSPVCGIWQATADGARVALVAGSVPGVHRQGSAPAGYSTSSPLLMILLDTARPGLRPGTVMGWATPAATPGRWDATVFTKTDGRELHTPRSFTLHLADANHLVLKNAQPGLKITLWKLLPYMLRRAVSESRAAEENPDGLLRLWPPSPDTPPLRPVYL